MTAISFDSTPPPFGASVRSRRRQMRMTLQEVCAAASISPGYLSQIERDQAIPTLTTLSRIAAALGVSLDFFISRPEPTACISRVDEREQFSVGGSDILYERLGAGFAGHELSSFITTVPSGYRSETVTHEGEETLFMLSGRLILSLEGEDMELGPGDSAHYRATRPHGWANPGAEAARILWTGTIDLFGRPTIAAREQEATQVGG